MVETQYRCQNERRRLAIRRSIDADGVPRLNGIDYLEVAEDRQTLLLHCIHPLAPLQLELENIQIESLDRASIVTVNSLSVVENVVTLGVKVPVDRSTYKLQLRSLEADAITPPQGFDPILSQVDFSISLPAISEFDCQDPPRSPDRPPTPPVIDYLAKDYSSFRQLMLDRLAVTMPQWKERSPADLGVVLVELVAYTADYLSYYQDAVATEAYLTTARKRVSVRRHARLLNYPMHDGCNARAWVVMNVEREYQLHGAVAPERDRSPYPGTRFLTKQPDLAVDILTDKQFKSAVNNGAIVFEAMQDVALHPIANELKFYTWGEADCYLQKGATTATLEHPSGAIDWLQPGRVILLEEIGIDTDDMRIDANPEHRHPVLITKVKVDLDPLFERQIINIEWAFADRLPFDLRISQSIADLDLPFSIVRGNVVLVDSGRTVNVPIDADEGKEISISPASKAVRLPFAPITQQGKVRNRQGKLVSIDLDLHSNPQASASQAIEWKLSQVMPAIFLVEVDPDNRNIGVAELEDESCGEVGGEIALGSGETTNILGAKAQDRKQRRNPHYWYPQRDLLNSDRFAREFVVEMGEDGRANLRFGDGNLGRKPSAGNKLQPIYRIGNGRAGNVGAEAIAHIYDDRGLADLTLTEDKPLRNPLPASGGIDPEPIEEVRLYAPQAFRTRQRAVTTDDYAEIAQRFPSVAKAVASRRWLGSWYAMFISIDRVDGLPVNESFKSELKQFLEPYRLTGHEIEIVAPRFVPLDLVLRVQVRAGYFRSEVKAALTLAFSNRVLQNGQRGFFHPDRFTFAQPVYLSEIIATAVREAGVQSVVVERFQRWGLPERGELAAGQIEFDRLEIASLDNAANRAGQGKMEFIMEGGL